MKSFITFSRLRRWDTQSSKAFENCIYDLFY